MKLILTTKARVLLSLPGIVVFQGEMITQSSDACLGNSRSTCLRLDP